VRRLTRVAFFALAAGAVAWTLSCARGDEPGRVLLLGLDGADPGTIDLLMSEGKLPNFSKLRREGAYAPLLSQKPLLSPVIWTTIATGKTPDRHRIGHFVAVNPTTGEQLPVTSQMRRVQAIWNILSAHDRSIDVVGWWATWPAENVRGTIVSDHFAYHFLMEEGAAGAAGGAGKVSPPEAEKRIAESLKTPQNVTAEELSPFVSVTAEELARPFDFGDDLSHFKWAWATAETYTSIGLQLWKEDRPDNLLLYIEGVDSTSHLFGHLFRAPALSGELAAQQKKYGHTVEAMYVYADRLLGRVMAAMDRKTTLLVLSDHGFELGKLQDDPSKTRDMRRVSEAFHRTEGILYMYGHRVKPRVRLNRPSILDVAPTVLALNGLGRASDMQGRVLAEALDFTIPAPVATYEPAGAPAAPESASAAGTSDSQVDPEIVKKLQSLGYIGATSSTGDRNLAAVAFEAGRFEEAAKEYARLVAEKPDDGSLRASYAGALGALGQYDAALAELTRAIELEPLNVEAYHNRAVIHERRGEKAAAVADYQTAVKYNPQYEPSRRALQRLGAPMPQQPRSDAEKRAVALAEEAAGAARRGDYAEANRKLDEASKAAPGLPLLYQYRANVAYLRGDTPGAIAALEQGLKVDPGNALYAENLKRLRLTPTANR
jgi:Flp pilus assembly protein TadD